MQIGRTCASLSISELFEKYPEVQILTTVFPEVTEIPCRIQSPFRVDNNPSFSIYLDNDKHVKFKDFGDTDCRGGLLDLLCKKWDCSFNQVFEKILAVMAEAQGSEVTYKVRQIKTLTRKESSELTKIEVKVRPWRDYDLEYWAGYGISKKWLTWAEVYPTAYKIVTKRDKETGAEKRYIFPCDKYCYTYVERKEGKLQLKIYSPFNTKGFKWCSSMDSSVISLWTKVPEYGDRIVICSSLKDALCLSANLGIPAIAPQGEGYSISDTACKELRRRYKQVFICFDVDEPGIQDARKLSEKTGFPSVVPDLKGQKDISDYFKSLKNKEEFKRLETLFH